MEKKEKTEKKDYAQALANAIAEGKKDLKLEGFTVFKAEGDKVKIVIPPVEKNSALHYAVKSAYMAACKSRDCGGKNKFRGVSISPKYWPQKSSASGGKGNVKGIPSSEREYSFQFTVNYDTVNLKEAKANLVEKFAEWLDSLEEGYHAEKAAYKEAAARRTYGGIVSSLLRVLDKEAAIVALTATIAQDPQYGGNAAEWANSLVDGFIAEREKKEAAQAEASLAAQA